MGKHIKTFPSLTTSPVAPSLNPTPTPEPNAPGGTRDFTNDQVASPSWPAEDQKPSDPVPAAPGVPGAPEPWAHGVQSNRPSDDPKTGTRVGRRTNVNPKDQAYPYEKPAEWVPPSGCVVLNDRDFFAYVNGVRYEHVSEAPDGRWVYRQS